MSIPSPHRSQLLADILVIDDTLVNLHLMAQILADMGCKVRKATSGERGLMAIEALPPDLVLLDIRMPGMDGYEVCRQIKASTRTNTIPIIFITALDDVTDKVKAFEVGGVDYITKPFHAQEVIARVRNHLTIRQLQQQLQAKNEKLEAEIRERLEAEVALQQANERLEFLATHDELTQLANRRYFNVYLHRVWRQVYREQAPLSLIMCDIDFFKRYNDTYGHTQGDSCLRAVAHAINMAIHRPFDLAARYGGEEFIIILPYTNLEGAVSVARRIQKQVMSLQIPHANSDVSSFVSLSLGVACVVPSEETDQTVETLVSQADQMLYESKRAGRNQVLPEWGFTDVESKTKV